MNRHKPEKEFFYNDRSEVIGAQRFYGSDIDDFSRPVTGRTFGYGYDPIGNRVSSYEEAGGRRLTTTYEANELNQYTSIQSAGAVPLRGDAAREATESVNGALAERDGGTSDFTPWSFALTSTSTTAHYQNYDMQADVYIDENDNFRVDNLKSDVLIQTIPNTSGLPQ